MAPPEKEEEEPQKFDYDLIHEIRAHNALVYAQGMAIVDKITKDWVYTPKTQEELDAEDAKFWPPEPTNSTFSSSNPIDSKFLISETERNNKALRAKLLPSKGLKASKARDAEEKAASAKRALKEESSDEEQGRSSLGKSKKLKVKHVAEAANAETPLINKALLPTVLPSIERDTDESAMGKDEKHNIKESMDVDKAASKPDDGNDQAEPEIPKKKKNKKKKNKRKKKSQVDTGEDTEVKTVSGPANSAPLSKPDDDQVDSSIVNSKKERKFISTEHVKEVKHDVTVDSALHKSSPVLTDNNMQNSTIPKDEDVDMPDIYFSDANEAPLTKIKNDEDGTVLGEANKRKKKKKHKKSSAVKEDKEMKDVSVLNANKALLPKSASDEDLSLLGETKKDKKKKHKRSNIESDNGNMQSVGIANAEAANPAKSNGNGQAKKSDKKKHKKGAATVTQEKFQPKNIKDLTSQPLADEVGIELVLPKSKKLDVKHLLSETSKKLEKLKREASDEPDQFSKKELPVDGELRRKLEKKKRLQEVKESKKSKKSRKSVASK